MTLQLINITLNHVTEVLSLSLQVLDIMYIFWLGYKFLIRNNVQQNDNVAKPTFRDSVISQALNVKIIILVLITYPNLFNKPSSLIFEVLLLTIALLLLHLIAYITWSYGRAWMAKKLASNFASNATVQTQRKFFGVMLIAISCGLLHQQFAQR